MAAILRLERKDYGGVEVRCVEDPDTPIYFAPHLLREIEAALGYPVEQLNIVNPPQAVKDRLNAILLARQAAREMQAKLAVFDEVRGNVEAQISTQLDRVRAYLEANPGVTLQQIRTAVLSKVQSLFTGEVI